MKIGGLASPLQGSVRLLVLEKLFHPPTQDKNIFLIKINSKARIIREDIIVYNGSIKTLQHEKDQVKEIKKDMDCGITLENCQDYKEGDIIEVYELVEIKR